MLQIHSVNQMRRARPTRHTGGSVPLLAVTLMLAGTHHIPLCTCKPDTCKPGCAQVYTMTPATVRYLLLLCTFEYLLD